MEQVVSDHSRAQEHLQRIVAALGAGVTLLDSNREIAWMDRRTRARLNGGMAHLASTLRALDAPNGISCCLSAQEVRINGEAAIVCLIQENDANQTGQGYDAIAAVSPRSVQQRRPGRPEFRLPRSASIARSILQSMVLTKLSGARSI
jgi:hypothetical protein